MEGAAARPGLVYFDSQDPDELPDDPWNFEFDPEEDKRRFRIGTGDWHHEAQVLYHVLEDLEEAAYKAHKDRGTYDTAYDYKITQTVFDVIHHSPYDKAITFKSDFAPWRTATFFDFPSTNRLQIQNEDGTIAIPRDVFFGIYGDTLTDGERLGLLHSTERLNEIWDSGEFPQDEKFPLPMRMTHDQYLLIPIVPQEIPVGHFEMKVLVRWGNTFEIAQRKLKNVDNRGTGAFWYMIRSGKYIGDAASLGRINEGEPGEHKQLEAYRWAGVTRNTNEHETWVKKICVSSDLERYLENIYQSTFRQPDPFRDSQTGLTTLVSGEGVSDASALDDDTWYIDRWPLPEDPLTLERANTNVIKQQLSENQFADPYEEQKNKTSLVMTGFIYPQALVTALDNLSRDPEANIIRVHMPKNVRMYNQLEYKVQALKLTNDKPVFAMYNGVPTMATKYQLTLQAMPAKGEYTDGAESGTEEEEGSVGVNPVMNIGKLIGMSPDQLVPVMLDVDADGFATDSKTGTITWTLAGFLSHFEGIWPS